MSTWAGSKPTDCQICNAKLTKSFVDGATRIGPWATLPCLNSGSDAGNSTDRGSNAASLPQSGRSWKRKSRHRNLLSMPAPDTVRKFSDYVIKLIRDCDPILIDMGFTPAEIKTYCKGRKPPKKNPWDDDDPMLS